MEDRRRNVRSDNEDLGSRDVYSRLFIVCPKKTTEEELREAFSEFGSIEDVSLPRDRNTGAPKGIAFIKFAKTSEAACAMETMNNRRLEYSWPPLRVVVACNRSDIQSDDNDDRKYKRLFITHPRNMEENDIYEEFNKFGKVASVILQRDRNTSEPKGFAYVSYRTFSETAYAFEQAEKKYRAVFAAPKNQNHRPVTTFESNINSLADVSANESTLMAAMNVQPGNYVSVNFKCSPQVSQFEIERLFDIVPGFLGCQYFMDLFKNFSKGTVTYSNTISAAYAVQKLNGFQYPPGMQIFVKPDIQKRETYEKLKVPNVVNNLKNAITVASNSTNPDLAQLAEAIAEASKLIKTATGLTDQDNADSNDLTYCSVKLPPPQPLVDIDSPVAKRCFLVCKPQPPPLTVLRDVFCRFGNLINVYTIPNKTVGYARYATVESADEAIKTLHGAELCGVRIKVLEADEEQPPSKRSRQE